MYPTLATRASVGTPCHSGLGRARQDDTLRHLVANLDDAADDPEHLVRIDGRAGEAELDDGVQMVNPHGGVVEARIVEVVVPDRVDEHAVDRTERFRDPVGEDDLVVVLEAVRVHDVGIVLPLVAERDKRVVHGDGHLDRVDLDGDLQRGAAHHRGLALGVLLEEAVAAFVTLGDDHRHVLVVEPLLGGERDVVPEHQILEGPVVGEQHLDGLLR